MRIGIDASRIALEERTGTENYTYNLIEAIKRVDKVNQYTIYFNKLPQYFEISQANVSTRYIPLPKLWTQVRLASEVLMDPPDILFVPAHTLPIIRRPNLKTVVTVHDLGAEYLPHFHKFPSKYYLTWTTRYCANNASKVISVSEATKKDLVKRFGVNKEKVKVIHEGVDKKFFFKRKEEEIKPVLAKYGLNKPYLFFVGTIQPRKNLEFLIECFSQIKNKNVDLVLVGKPGWLYEEIFASPKKFGVESRVKFLGFIPAEELAAIYSSAEAFVYPSLFEGFGLPLLEAMASGCPIIASNTTSVPEIVGNAGLLFNPKKKNELVSLLNKFLSSKTISGDLIQEGYQRIKNFSWDKTARETISLFEEVYEAK